MSAIELYTDPRYVKSTNGACPLGNELVYGNTRPLGVTGQRRVPSYSINTTTPYECYLKAAEFIELYNSWLDIMDPTPQQKTDYAMIDVYKRDAKLGTIKIQGYSASFYTNRAEAPFGENCHIEFGPCAAVDNNDRVLTVKGGFQMQTAMLSPCTIPFKRADCITSQVSGTRSPICTWTAADTTGNPCFTWYRELPDEQGYELSFVNKTDQSRLICQNYPDLPECDCIARASRPLYNSLKTQFTSVSDICWYLPCKREGYDRQMTPLELKQRGECKTTVCQNILTIVESSSNSLSDLQQAISCSREEWDRVSGTGGGPGGSGGNTDATSQAWVPIIVVVAIVVIGIALIFFALRKTKDP